MPRERNRKVLLVANTSWYLYNFRRPLMRALRSRGLEPVLLAPQDEYSARLSQEGFRWQELDVPRNRLNPWRELMGFLAFVAAYRRERPQAVHHFTIKCVIYGTFAAILTGVPFRINAITGLGHVFLTRGWKAQLLRGPLKLAYRFVLAAKGSRVIFQNEDDRGVFVQAGLVAPERTFLIRSSGVDLAAFRPGPRAPAAGVSATDVHVVFASRLLREKGIVELIEAIRLLKSQGQAHGLVFSIAGGNAAGNPSSVSEEQVAAWAQEGLARFLGHVDPIAELLAQSDLVVLPSYREGAPRILLEACAMEKAVIATDVPGCREVVSDGLNGLLVPPRDASALAAAILRLARDPELRERMGKAGRAKVKAQFADVEVARRTLEAYEALGVIRGQPDARASAVPIQHG